jgi:capsule polysaccharide export protein KpsE/RkpR
MKPNKFTITLLSTVAFAAGCSKEGTTQQLDKVQAKTEAVAQDMKDYSYAQKGEFIQKMRGQLAQINHDLEVVAAKVEKSSDTVKAEANPKIGVLRGKADQLRRQLDDTKNATESTWESVKTESRNAFDDLKDGFQNARQWVSDKVAP